MLPATSPVPILYLQKNPEPPGFPFNLKAVEIGRSETAPVNLALYFIECTPCFYPLITMEALLH